MSKTVMVVLLAALASGCVSSGKYNKALKQLSDAEAMREQQVEERERTIAERDARIVELGDQIKAKDAEIAAAKEKDLASAGEIARLEAERTRLEGELAAVLRDRAQLKASAKEMEEALAETSKRKAEAEKRVAEFRRLIQQFKSLIDAGKLKVKIVDGRMVLALNTDVLFASGSAELSQGGFAAIVEVSNILTTLPDRRFQIEGHTDNVPIKTSRFPSNWELASARAVVVVNTMIAAGMAPGRVSAAAYGEFRPTAGNETPAGKAANRRIEIVLVPDLSSLPGFDELQRAVNE